MTREAVDTIVAIVIQAAERTALTARQTAELAWYPGHSLVSIDAIEALINQASRRRRRGVRRLGRRNGRSGPQAHV